MVRVDEEKPSPCPDPDSPNLHRFPGASKAKLVDIISLLPFDIMDRLFSFMDMTEVVQTSVLSRRWRDLWKMTSNLNFDSDLMDTFIDSSKHDDLDSDEIYERKQCHFLELLDNVFSRRDNVNVENLKLKSEFDLEASDLKRWLDSILEKDLHVKNLYLDVLLLEECELPTRLFNSKLKTLILVGGYPGPFFLGLPTSVCSAEGIRRINLMYVKLPEGNADKKITLSCSLLEDLRICECASDHLIVFTIRTPMLKRLELIGEDYPLCVVNILCPALTSLACSGCLSKVWSVENPSALISASIRFYEDTRIQKELFPLYLRRVLKGLQGVKSLRISSLILQTMTEHPEIVEVMPDIFYRLKELVVDECSVSVLSISSVADLLKELPSLEAFSWETTLVSTMLVAEVSNDFIFSGLKTVNVRNFLGLQGEVKLLEFLLKSSISLEEMVITAATGNREEMREVTKKLFALPRSSPNVTIVVKYGGFRDEIQLTAQANLESHQIRSKLNSQDMMDMS